MKEICSFWNHIRNKCCSHFKPVRKTVKNRNPVGWWTRTPRPSNDSINVWKRVSPLKSDIWGISIAMSAVTIFWITKKTRRTMRNSSSACLISILKLAANAAMVCTSSHSNTNLKRYSIYAECWQYSVCSILEPRCVSRLLPLLSNDDKH